MNLLTNEHEIRVSNGNRVVLTNMRLHMSDKDWGYSYSNTIFLEDIGSIETKYKSNVILLVLAAAALLAGIGASANSYDSSSGSTLFFVTAIFLFLIYWFSRRHIVSITPNGGKAINFVVSKLGSKQTEDFIDDLQAAKLQRLNEIYKL